MSPIFFFAPAFALVASAFLWWGIFRVTRNWHKPAWTSSLGCLLPLLAFPLLTIIIFTTLPAYLTETGTSSTPQEANLHLVFFDVPSTAHDVDYRHAYFSGTIDEANFSIAADDYFAWMSEKNWKPQEFNSSDYVYVNRLFSPDTEEIANGYRYDDYDEASPDSGFSVVYDKETHRAYMWKTTF